MVVTTTYQQTFTASGPTITRTAAAETQTVVQTYTTVLPGDTKTTTLQGPTITQYSTIPGSTFIITYTTSVFGSTEIIERTTTLPAQTSTIFVTRSGGTVTLTLDPQTSYVTATTTIPAASVFYVQTAGGVYTQSGEVKTVTVAYCPCYPGMKFARANNATHIYQHCSC
ncbi:hypothetical protein WHR41_03958 [Cladosporium halotolerans]|uniref:Uncharacterized protein n=1 Tax=Cladosporium halotolerans TaxID=1052096 RepID=A0AB34KQP5_9PEZI